MCSLAPITFENLCHLGRSELKEDRRRKFVVQVPLATWSMVVTVNMAVMMVVMVVVTVAVIVTLTVTVVVMMVVTMTVTVIVTMPGMLTPTLYIGQ